ncbi:MAG: hypothetical protein RMJ75_06745 [Nitrososphaerota archaeon]|nr:hypothetical protein [Nitrososphaerota archaeon]
MNRSRNSALVIALALIAAITALASYAVVIALDSNDVAQLGGTNLVDVRCPAAGTPCRIDRITWTLSSSAPYTVTRANVVWNTAKTSGATYTVYVVLYDSTANNVIGSGSAVQAASASQVTTQVPISPNPRPRDVYYVEVVIVEN